MKWSHESYLEFKKLFQKAHAKDSQPQSPKLEEKNFRQLQ